MYVFYLYLFWHHANIHKKFTQKEKHIYTSYYIYIGSKQNFINRTIRIVLLTDIILMKIMHIFPSYAKTFYSLDTLCLMTFFLHILI